jgi:hypothetical protein
MTNIRDDSGVRSISLAELVAGITDGSIDPSVDISSDEIEGLKARGWVKLGTTVYYHSIRSQVRAGATLGAESESSEANAPPRFTREQRFCPNCGSRVAAEAKFCASCGTKVACDPADKMHVGRSNSEARNRVTEVQSASQQRKAQRNITAGVVLIILGAFLALLGGPVADQAQQKTTGLGFYERMTSDAQTQYKLGKVMSLVGPFLIVGGVAKVILGFAKKKDSSGT